MDLKKWWPNGYGNQNLYPLNVVFQEEVSKETVQISKKIGFRTIDLIQEPVSKGKGKNIFYS